MSGRVWRVAATLTLASVGTALLPPAAHAAASAAGHRDPLSVAVQASGGQDVSYAIEVRNTTDRPVPDAVITQQLPPGLDYVAATPTPHRTGRHLTWTLAIPAHGTARITTTGTAGHHLGARPLAQVGTVRHGHHPQLTTMVCAREQAGPQDCATGRGALRPEALSRWERTALALACAGGAATLGFGAAGRWRRRRAMALERASVEG